MDSIKTQKWNIISHIVFPYCLKYNIFIQMILLNPPTQQLLDSSWLIYTVFKSVVQKNAATISLGVLFCFFTDHTELDAQISASLSYCESQRHTQTPVQHLQDLRFPWNGFHCRDRVSKWQGKRLYARCSLSHFTNISSSRLNVCLSAVRRALSSLGFTSRTILLS